MLSPATQPIATTATGAVPSGDPGTIASNPTGGIPTDALIPGAIYAMDCSGGRYGNVYGSAAEVDPSDTRTLYIYNSGATSMSVFRQGTKCPAGTLGQGY